MGGGEKTSNEIAGSQFLGARRLSTNDRVLSERRADAPSPVARRDEDNPMVVLTPAPRRARILPVDDPLVSVILIRSSALCVKGTREVTFIVDCFRCIVGVFLAGTSSKSLTFSFRIVIDVERDLLVDTTIRHEIHLSLCSFR